MTVQLLEKQQTPETARVNAPKTPAALPLEKLLADVSSDSKKSPQQYLDETVVPFGGE
ncbi:MAG: hypothetical protein N2C14_11420 [Planctomycetales bacterium]